MTVLQPKATGMIASTSPFTRSLSLRLLLLSLLVCTWLNLHQTETQAAPSSPAKRPNVIVVMTDNQGAWTLGCYGNQEIRTPHIDRLAREGTLFERAYASNPVCSPTRATFLTGLMPSQHGVHSFLFSKPLQVGPEARSTMDEFVTLPEILKAAGYSCGLVGKWHLGDNLNSQEGFEDYWITMPHGGTSTFYDANIIENGEIRKEPTYLTDFWTDHATRFIDQASQEDKPFFLFLAYNGPYSLGRLLLKPGQNRHAAAYAEQSFTSFPREKAHPWQLNNLDFHNNPISIARVATEVSGVDDGVGTVLQTLQDRGIDDDTLIVYVADQGWVGGQGGFFGMGDHTDPVTARDGMMQIPLIFHHPNHVAAGQRSNLIVTNYDLLPTLLNYLELTYDPSLNTGGKPARQPELPGRDFSPVLKGETPDEWDNVVFYEYESLRCVRTADWKYIARYPNGPTQLYHLAVDPNEQHNLIGQPQYEQQILKLDTLLQKHFRQFSDAQYNLWQGGESQNRMLNEIEPSHLQSVSATYKLENLEDFMPFDLEFEPVELQLPEGYTAQLVAAPPLVQHPTLGCLDDRGRLYVCDNAGVNMTSAELEAELPNRIRRLEDIDGDGIYDRSTIFADKMTFPMGGCWIGDSLYVASPPNIWKLTDADDDGVAETRTPIVSKFGYTGNAASIHGCFAGPDGRIYWCDGYHGHEIAEGDAVISERFGSYLFSSKTDGSDVRIHAGGGMDNPVEVDFTTAGQMLGTCNIMYTRPRIDTFVNWQYGGVYPHRENVLQESKTTGPFLEPIHHFGHVAISGTTRYRSGTLDHNWRDDYFATFFNLGKVVRLELTERGSTFAVTQREFLSTENRDFHPTDVLEDRDGSLLVIDTGGWFYRGCPTSQISKPDISGGIYRIRKTGMTQFADPGGDRIDYSELDSTALLKLFNSTRYWVRERAMRECAERGTTMVPALASLLKRADIRPRQNAAWVLGRLLGQIDAASPDSAEQFSQVHTALRTGLTDRDPSVRQIVCQILLSYPDAAATAALTERLESDTAAVRRVAAAALGRSGDGEAIPALLAALETAVDRDQQHALIYALIELDEFSATSAGLKSEHAAVRNGALIAVDQMESGQLSPTQLISALLDTSPAVQQSALNILTRRRSEPQFATAISDLLSGSPQVVTAAMSKVNYAILLSLFAKEDQVATRIGAILQDRSSPPELTRQLLKQIPTVPGTRLDPSWQPTIVDRLQSADPSEIEPVLPMLGLPRDAALTDQLTQLVSRMQIAAVLRVKLLQRISGSRSRLSSESFDLLLEVIAEPASSADYQAATELLGSSSLTADQLIGLAPLLETAGTSQLRRLIRPYAGSAAPEVATAFLDGIEASKVIANVPFQEISDIIKRYPTQQRERANRLLAQLQQLEQEKLNTIDRLLPLLSAGNPERGRELFAAETTKCATCHQIGSTGKNVGPDLSAIGANRAPRDLLESILFPSATIVRDYDAYTVVLIDGRVLNGLIARETAQMVEIQDATGKKTQIPKDEIELLSPSDISIMPSGLEKTLTDSQLADLIAYLAAQKKSAVTKTVQAP